MTYTPSGRKRFRPFKRVFRSTLLVLQIEMVAVDDSGAHLSHGRLDPDTPQSVWVDARVEDVTVDGGVKL